MDALNSPSKVPGRILRRTFIIIQSSKHRCLEKLKLRSLDKFSKTKQSQKALEAGVGAE